MYLNSPFPPRSATKATSSRDGSADITPAMLDDFEGLLRDLCLELLNPDIPFRAATRKEACRYCDVHSFCPLRP